MVRTRVGYTGGRKAAPTYRSLGDHSEAIQIDFDPARISYAAILDIFWKSHDPTRHAWSRQYMSAIFYHNAAQKRQAEASKARESLGRAKKVVTRILPFDPFHLAEDYHQKYQLRQHRMLLDEFTAMYPRTIDLIHSTAAARVNGYVGGNGAPDAIRANLDRLGLSPRGRLRLLEIAGLREN